MLISKNEYSNIMEILATEIEEWTMEGFAAKYEEEWTSKSINESADLKEICENIISEIMTELNLEYK